MSLHSIYSSEERSLAESTKTSEVKNAWPGRVGIAKDGLDVIKQVLVVAILLLFVIWPTGLQRSLSTLGFNELDLGVAKFKVAQNASEKAGDAAQRLAETSKTIAAVQQKVHSLAERTNSSEIRADLEGVNSTLKQLSDNSDSAQQDLNASLAVQASVIQNAAPQDVTDSGAWGIVISGDKNLDPDAKDEFTKAKNAGFSNVKIYERDKWYRTVVEFSSFSEAQAALPRLRALPNHASSYLVTMTKWCPTRKDSGNGTLQCVAS
jgi:hypothetical protein